jgi:hypothetical protein
VLLKFPFIGSTLLAHGLFSPANKSGLWTRGAYGPVSYRGQDFSLPNWAAKENPYPTTEVHNIDGLVPGVRSGGQVAWSAPDMGAGPACRGSAGDVGVGQTDLALHPPRVRAADLD